MGGPDDKALRLYDEHAKSCAPDDFWGQVKRTVGGQPVNASQIDMIVDSVRNGLTLSPQDILLDLCCGNGALTDKIFDFCAGGVGVDASPHLIEIARSNFERLPTRRYIVGEVSAFAAATPENNTFTKALCYGSFKYLSNETARRLLEHLRGRFAQISLIFIGNNADKALAKDFFYEGAYRPGVEDAHDSFLGMWRSEEEFSALAARAGWNVHFHRMPPAFYAARFCYDAILMRA